MAMINYADKVALNQNSNIADINKVKADDMNELKKAFNNQVAFGWYQTGLSPTFTYSSWDSSVYTGVVNSNLDLTPYLSVGMKVKFTQSGATKYGIITAITSTQLTLFLGTDYSINNSAISNTYFSMIKAPYGFPLNPDKWTILVTDTTERNVDNPTQNQWYYTNINFYLPIGAWRLNLSHYLLATRGNAGNTSVFSTISTASATQSDANMTTVLAVGPTTIVASNLVKFANLTTATKRQYFINIRTTDSGLSTIRLKNDQSSLVVELICAYL